MAQASLLIKKQRLAPEGEFWPRDWRRGPHSSETTPPVNSHSSEGLGRLAWGLGGVAFAIAGVLLASSLRPVHENGDTVRVIPAGELPAWKPDLHWASSLPPVRHAGEAIKLPIYPPWSESQARQLFTPGEFDIFDEYCGKLYQPNIRFSVPFAEYPRKQIEFVVNSLSMREDDEPLAVKPQLRVLVAGDSHTDGVCQNCESFPNLTEAALRERASAESTQRKANFDPRSIEVLNAGKGGHSFFNYLGTLERNLDLEPDVFVVTVYGGNDFHELLSAWHTYRNDGKRPPGAASYPDEIKAAQAISSQGLNQAFYELKYFDVYPEQMRIALDCAVEVCGQIQALCRERGIRLIVLYLPPRQEIEPDNPALNIRKLLRALKLEPAALANATRLGDEFLSRVAESGIEHLDLRPAFRQAGESLYWNADWHINLAGQRVVARELVRTLSARD